MSLVMAAKSPSNPYTLVREGKVPGKKNEAEMRMLNPFIPDKIPCPYQLDESFSNLSGFG